MLTSSVMSALVATSSLVPTLVMPLSPAPQNKTANLVGKAAPNFTVSLLGGRTFDLSKQRGKPVLLDFWATWCGPCKKASPLMNRLHQAHSAKGLQVVAISIMEDESGPAPVQAYQRKHNYRQQFAFNGDKVAERYGVTGVPEFVLIDRRGRVVRTWTGYTDAIGKEIEAAVRAQMATR